MITILLLLSTNIFASGLSDRLVGNYEPVTCVGAANLRIIPDGDGLYVEARRADGAYEVSKTIRLGTRGRNFDCTPYANYTKEECRVRETKDSLTLTNRGCLLFCGAWNLELRLKELKDQQLVVETYGDGEPCIFKKVPPTN